MAKGAGGGKGGGPAGAGPSGSGPTQTPKSGLQRSFGAASNPNARVVQKQAQFQANARSITTPRQQTAKVPKPALNLNPPAPTKTIQNHTMLNEAAAKRSAAARAAKAPKQAASPPSAKQAWAQAKVAKARKAQGQGLAQTQQHGLKQTFNKHARRPGR